MDNDNDYILSDEQKSILDKLLDWYRKVKPSDKKEPPKKESGLAIEDILLPHTEIPVIEKYITLGGYAGTGKTTLLSHFRNTLDLEHGKIKVAFCSYTGKATRVLQQKLFENNSVYSTDNISTIHGLIYSPVENNKDEIVGWEKREEINYDLIIIDEASMIDQNIWKDLLSYQIPIIAVGDHGQLPPINGSFNLMEKPQLKIEEIHRQAKDNPIIKISMQARLMGTVSIKDYGTGIRKISKSDLDTRDLVEDLLNAYNNDTLVLCGYNHTRVKLNNYIRNLLGFYDPEPQVNDRVICLRNNHEKKIYNGMLGNIYSIYTDPDDDRFYKVEILMDGEKDTYNGSILKAQFNQPPMNFTKDRRLTLNSDLFDFGYALTVHKAQGSQAKRVILFEERFAKMDQKVWNRWLYTAITRAEEELYIIGE